jgi:hypothetical protein
MISKEYVERVSVEAHRYSDEQMAGELHQFFEEQTAMCEFIAEVTTESSPEVQELSFSLSYVIFKAAKLGSNGALAAVPADRVEAAYHEAESWVDRIHQAAETDAVPGLLRDIEDEPEPHLIRYVISELNQPLENGDQLEDEEKGEVFFVLKVVIGSLAGRALGAEAKV